MNLHTQESKEATGIHIRKLKGNPEALRFYDGIEFNFGSGRLHRRGKIKIQDR